MLAFLSCGLLGLVAEVVDFRRTLHRLEMVAEHPLVGHRLDPSTATLPEWTLIPGIGPAVAGRIDAARRDGRLDRLRDVSGVGPITLREAAPFLVHPAGRSLVGGADR